MFIGVWIYALGNLSVDATLRVAAVLIVVRTMIGPSVWSLIFNYNGWDLESLTYIAEKMDASADSQQTAMELYRTFNLEALMISTKKIYGVLVLIGGAVLVYVSFLNMEGLDKRRFVLLRKRLKRQEVKGYKRDVEAQMDEEIKEEVKAASAAVL